MSVLAQLASSQPSHAVGSQPAPGGGQMQSLLSGLLGELLNSALLTATTASLGNAITQSAGRHSINQLTCYLPPEPSLYPQSRLQICCLPGALQLTSALADYYDQLSFMRDLMTRWFPRSDQPRREAQVELTSVVEAWQNVAHRALPAIEELSRRVDAEALQMFQERAEQVRELLMRTAAGETPCIDAFGGVKIPAWADRRREARNRRGVQAYFQVEDSLQRAAVLDSSEDGVGVLGLRGVEVGSRVGLLVKPGYALDGTVVWVNGPRAGIRLDAPLAADSHLLTHLY